jgi:two-component system CheB/CheR fusion protein
MSEDSRNGDDTSVTPNSSAPIPGFGVSSARPELPAREHHLRTLADNVPELFSYVDAEGRYRYVNRRYREMFDRSGDEILGRTVAELLGAAAYRKIRPYVESALSGEEVTFQTELDIASLRRPVHVRYVPDIDAAGRVAGFFSLITDMTEQRGAERRLRESEARTQAILQALSANIAVLNSAGEIKQVNVGWEQFCRDNGGELRKCGLGVNYLAVCEAAAARGADEGRLAGDGIRDVLDGSRPSFTLEYPCHSPTEERWFRMEVTPMPTADGGAVISHSDISSRFRAEVALRKQHEFSERLLNLSPNIVLVLDSAGRIVQFNRYLEDLCGWKLDEVIGHDWFDVFVRERDRERGRQVHEELIRGIRLTQICHVIVSRDGKEFEIEWQDTPLWDPSGRTTGLLWSGRDVTEKRMLEREILEISSEERQTLGQELHDGICQELTGLAMLAQGLVDSLEESSATGAAGPHSRQALADAARRLTDGISRASEQARNLSHGLIPVDVDAQGLASALEELAVWTREVGAVECDFVCEGQVAISDSYVATHLYRIAQEAVRNALRHASPRRIGIGLATDGGRLDLRVADDGTGFSEAVNMLPGMGLRIMRYRADLIGGDLTIDSSRRRGTRVLCSLQRDGGHFQSVKPGQLYDEHTD